MLIGAAVMMAAFAIGFGYLTTDALRSGHLRGVRWSVGKMEAPIRYWAGVGAYGLNTIVAATFTFVICALLFVR